MSVFFSDSNDGAIVGGLTGGQGARIRYSFGNAPPHGVGMVPPCIELSPVTFETTVDGSPIRIAVRDLEQVVAELKRRQTIDGDDAK